MGTPFVKDLLHEVQLESDQLLQHIQLLMDHSTEE
jgi:hypothetical protein